MLIYCDSVIFIYFLNAVGPFQLWAAACMAVMRAAGDTPAFSDLSRLECRVKPVKLGDATTLAEFDAFFGGSAVRLVPIDTAVFDQATAIRAKHNFKLGDSLHLAAAVEGGCDHYLTNDTRLSSFSDIPVEILS